MWTSFKMALLIPMGKLLAVDSGSTAGFQCLVQWYLDTWPGRPGNQTHSPGVYRWLIKSYRISHVWSSAGSMFQHSSSNTWPTVFNLLSCLAKYNKQSSGPSCCHFLSGVVSVYTCLIVARRSCACIKVPQVPMNGLTLVGPEPGQHPITWLTRTHVKLLLTFS